MNVVYAKQPFPSRTKGSIFLAGPTPRDPSVPSWRPEALRLLQESGWDGDVYVPEPDGDTPWDADYEGQVEWEETALHCSDIILFWIPRDLTPLANGSLAMPGLTTNIEFGVWAESGKVVLGYPEGAPSMRYPRHYADKHQMLVGSTLDETLDLATCLHFKFAQGPVSPEREGGECSVPLHSSPGHIPATG